MSRRGRILQEAKEEDALEEPVESGRAPVLDDDSPGMPLVPCPRRRGEYLAAQRCVEFQGAHGCGATCPNAKEARRAAEIIRQRFMGRGARILAKKRWPCRLCHEEDAPRANGICGRCTSRLRQRKCRARTQKKKPCARCGAPESVASASSECSRCRRKPPKKKRR